MHHIANGTSVKTDREEQGQESAILLGSYLDEPDKWYFPHYRYTVAITFKIVSSIKLDRPTSDLEDFRRMTTEFVISIGGSAYNYFPLLKKNYRNGFVSAANTGTTWVSGTTKYCGSDGCLSSRA